MIDENSHHSQTTTKVAARTICFLSENVHPSKVFSTSTGVNPSFRSQEPRRPRFSFFYLHNVKELTIPPSPASIVIGSQASRILSENMNSLLVAQQVILLLSETVNSGRS